MKYINVAEANCKNCYKCLKVCPVKSIKYSDNHVEVLEGECVLCGRCIRNCPQHAKSLVHDVSGIKQAVRSSARKKVAALAPSYIASFKPENRMKMAEALRRLGFDAVEETSVGAHAVTKKYAELLEKGAMDNFITTCCPTVVFLVQKYFPNLTPQLAPVLSPMEAHGKILKEKYGDDALVVFFAPCISKIEEARISEKRYIDGVLTFRQLAEWFGEEGVVLEECGEGYFSNDPSASAVYPIFDGIVKDVTANLAPDSEALRRYHFLGVQGTKDLIELLQEMEGGHIHDCFIEASACYGSCINGPERPEMDYRPVSTGVNMTRYLAGEKNVREGDFSALDLSRRIIPTPVKEDIPSERR